MSQAQSSTVSYEFIQQALHTAVKQQRVLEPLLSSCQLPLDILQQDSRQRVPVAVFAKFWRHLSRFLQDEFCGMDQRQMRPGSFAFLCKIAAQQPTVAAGIEVGLQFLALIFADKRAVLRREQNMAVIILREEASTPARAFTYFTFWMYVHGLTCWLANQRIPILSIDSRSARPDNLDDYRLMFSENLRFDCRQSRLLFASDALDSPIRRTEQDLKRFLMQAPNNIMVKYRDPLSLTSQIRQRLLQQTPKHWPDLVQLAEQLCMSVSTLRRRLLEEGQTYQQLKDSVRKSLALQFLAEEAYTFVEIAGALGFADVSSFYKAFRKWTGVQPGHYRNLLLGEGE